MTTWTNQDESNIARVRAELSDLENRRQYAVYTVEQAVMPLVQADCFRNGTVNQIALILIANADQLRDALAPFDTGVRVQEVV